MKIDFSVKIVSLAGIPVKDQTGTEDLTLGSVCVNALLTLIEGQKRLSGMERKKQADLADRIYGQDIVNLDVKDISLLKDLAGELYPPLIVKRVWDLLDPQDEKPGE
jgi:hypothetical protein